MQEKEKTKLSDEMEQYFLNNAHSNFKKLREGKKLNQDNLALQIDVTRNTITNYENSNSFVGGRQLICLKLLYPTIPLDYYLGLTESMEKENIEVNKQLGLSDKSIKKLEEVSSSNDLIFKNLYQFALNKIIETIDLEKLGTYLITPSINNKKINIDEELKISNSQNPNHYFDDFQIDEDNQDKQNYKIYKYLNDKFDKIKEDPNILESYNYLSKLIDEKFDNEEKERLSIE